MFPFIHHHCTARLHARSKHVHYNVCSMIGDMTVGPPLTLKRNIQDRCEKGLKPVLSVRTQARVAYYLWIGQIRIRGSGSLAISQIRVRRGEGRHCSIRKAGVLSASGLMQIFKTAITGGGGTQASNGGGGGIDRFPRSPPGYGPGTEIWAEYFNSK